jgi:hypothetical protein
MYRFAMLVFFGLLCTIPSPELAGQSTAPYIQILNRFEQWKSTQYKNGSYATEKNCNPATVLKEGYKGAWMGIPKDINISFTDINGDGKLDGLVLFNPDQCDGGNASMNAQVRVLIFSGTATYSTDDSLIDKIEAGLKSGWLNIEKAAYGTLYGTFYDYADEDPRCCPSISRAFMVDFKTKKLEFLN